MDLMKALSANGNSLAEDFPKDVVVYFSLLTSSLFCFYHGFNLIALVLGVVSVISSFNVIMWSMIMAGPNAQKWFSERPNTETLYKAIMSFVNKASGWSLVYNIWLLYLIARPIFYSLNL